MAVDTVDGWKDRRMVISFLLRFRPQCAEVVPKQVILIKPCNPPPPPPLLFHSHLSLIPHITLRHASGIQLMDMV